MFSHSWNFFFHFYTERFHKFVSARENFGNTKIYYRKLKFNLVEYQTQIKIIFFWRIAIYLNCTRSEIHISHLDFLSVAVNWMSLACKWYVMEEWQIRQGRWIIRALSLILSESGQLNGRLECNWTRILSIEVFRKFSAVTVVEQISVQNKMSYSAQLYFTQHW